MEIRANLVGQTLSAAVGVAAVVVVVSFGSSALAAEGGAATDSEEALQSEILRGLLGLTADEDTVAPQHTDPVVERVESPTTASMARPGAYGSGRSTAAGTASGDTRDIVKAPEQAPMRADAMRLAAWQNRDDHRLPSRGPDWGATGIGVGSRVGVAALASRIRDGIEREGRIAIRIQFAHNSGELEHPSAEVMRETLAQLRGVAAALNGESLRRARILIGGHTDATGKETYNQMLSKQRAEAVLRYLVEELRVDASRLSAEGYGSTQPLPDVSQTTLTGRQAQRRVEFVKLDPDGHASAGPYMVVPPLR